MRKLMIGLMTLALMAGTPLVEAGGHRGGGSHFGRSHAPRTHSFHSTRSYRSFGGITRDSRGRIKRSSSAKHEFMRASGHPHGWSGHVVDHKIPLKRGGADAPYNMQWQTKEAAKLKDKWE